MKKITYFTIIFMLLGCAMTPKQIEPVYIYYKYNDVYITRIDKDNEHYFYFGKFNKGTIFPKSYFIGRYSGGFDASFCGYLVFNKNSVEFIQLHGEIIERVGVNNHFYTLNDYIIRKEEDTLCHRKSYPNIKQIKMFIASDTVNYDKSLFGKWDVNNHNSTSEKFISPIQKSMRLTIDISSYYLVSYDLTNYENRILFDRVLKNNNNFKNIIFFDHDYLREKVINKESKSEVIAIYPE